MAVTNGGAPAMAGSASDNLRPAPKRVWYTPAQIERARRLRAGGYTFAEISARMGVGKSGLCKLEQRGWKRHTFGGRPCPADLSYQAAHLTVVQLQQHYGCANKTLRAWLAEKGITMPNRQHRHPLRPCPSDFAEVAAWKGVRALAQHYHATSSTVHRWAAEHGLLLGRTKPTPPAPPSQVGWVERYVADQRASRARNPTNPHGPGRGPAIPERSLP